MPEKNIRIEIGSAADPIKERPVFQKLIDQELKENDLLFVTKIDRCSRNILEFLKFEHEMKGKFIKTYHDLLIQNYFEEFERQLSTYFLT